MRWWKRYSKKTWKLVQRPKEGDKLVLRQEFWDFNGMSKAKVRNEVPAVVHWVRSDGSFQVFVNGATHNVSLSGKVIHYAWRGEIYIPTESVKGKKRWMHYAEPLEALGQVGVGG